MPPQVLLRRTTPSTIPAPLSIFPAQKFLGDDGDWSTYPISVGSPPQQFYVLPSTLISETWVPLPDGCTPTDPSDCQPRRGGAAFNGLPPAGFLTNESTTWSEIGLYGLQSELNLGFFNDNALFGNDTLTLNPNGGTNESVLQAPVGGIATKDYFLGMMGLSISSSIFSTAAQPSQTMLQHLYNSKVIPSQSFSYTAGASYMQQNSTTLYPWGSLVLGGYDTTKFKQDNSFSVPFSSQNNAALTVGVQSIIATNVLNGTVSLTATTGGGFTALIDSTVSQLWLPGPVCDQFHAQLNLTYDANTNLYVISNEAHQKLLDRNPSFTFSLGATSYNNGQSLSLSFPYSAFDFQVGWPFYSQNTTVYYFPIRKAANATQYVLGRTILQQAHITVDYDRRNFTVAQASFPDLTENAHLVAITPSTSGSNGGGGSGKLGAGAIAGIAIGAIAGIAFLLFLIFLICRRRARKTKSTELDGTSGGSPEFADAKTYHEADGDPLVEMSGEHQALSAVNNSHEPIELAAPVFYEMDGNSSGTGLDVKRDLSPQTASSGRNSTPFSPVSNDSSRPSPMRDEPTPFTDVHPSPRLSEK